MQMAIFQNETDQLQMNWSNNSLPSFSKWTETKPSKHGQFVSPLQHSTQCFEKAIEKKSYWKWHNMNSMNEIMTKNCIEIKKCIRCMRGQKLVLIIFQIASHFSQNALNLYSKTHYKLKKMH